MPKKINQYTVGPIRWVLKRIFQSDWLKFSQRQRIGFGLKTHLSSLNLCLTKKAGPNRSDPVRGDDYWPEILFGPVSGLEFGLEGGSRRIIMMKNPDQKAP